MKVAHLTLCRQLSLGQTRQLRAEYAASQKVPGIEWNTLAYHASTADEPFIRTLPPVYRSLFMRKLYGWLLAFRLSKSHHILMMRHSTFDPFAPLFAPHIRNRVTVHHSKEVEELLLIRKGWKGICASRLERWSGAVAVRNALGILGVTREIAEYQRALRAPEKLVGVYSNGIDPAEVQLLPDERDEFAIHAAFICGKFSPWHGLDKLLLAVDQHVEQGTPPLPIIHLIGNLTSEQKMEVSASERRKRVFRVHGLMRESEYRPILARCDIGIASLAMERENLSEGSTLKVREMLAMGLPIYSGHKDVALDEGQPFVKIASAPNLQALAAFGRQCKYIQRSFVREKSLPIIEKAQIMKQTARVLDEFSIVSNSAPKARLQVAV
jgi:hypothetical protein